MTYTDKITIRCLAAIAAAVFVMDFIIAGL
jgi:hypothetical protein